MIAVIGEALIDLIVAGDGEGGEGGGGKVTARPGGGPYTTARTLGRLGMAPVFLDRLSGDGFGRMLRARLDADGVTLGIPEPSEAPTTLAVAEIDSAGGARYGFYLTGTAAADLEYPALAAALPPGVTAVHVGTLGLVMEPIGSAAEQVILRDVPPDALVMMDPNCRPGAIGDRAAYLARIGRILRRADVVKVSVEDLDYLSPGVPVPTAAAAMLDAGPALVLVTDGPRPARAFLPGQEIAASIPEVRVVDTIGAGDAFGGAFLAWWSAAGLTRSDLKRPGPVGEALRAAVKVAALTSTHAGAEPPWGTPTELR
ncbi:MAG TPA: carbohydrate kinase [Trebonia sp.]